MTESEPCGAGGRLSIGEIARLAGVTPRAIRHYHAMGLLPEPGRVSSGHRRYGADDVIALVRVARLRALGMPIPQIRDRLATTGGTLSAGLMSLADELDGEIHRLAATRDRLRELAAAQTFDNPAQALAQALRGHRLLGEDQELPPEEVAAAELLDALHPRGMPGVLDQAGTLLADPDSLGRLAPLLERFRALGDAPSDAEVDSLAADLAAALPRPEHAAPPIDVGLMDQLLGDRLTVAQRRVMHRLRRESDGQ
jgi:DNA-binding transcriptional MerR regulator